MSDNWLKMRNSLPRNPKILSIASQLNITPLHACGLCFGLWAWADEQSVDGHAISVTDVTLDALVGVTGFCAALQSESVRWLAVESDGRITLPRFAVHNGKTAKSRANSARRQKKYRNANSVTTVTLPALPRIEKRRKEINTNTSTTACAKESKNQDQAKPDTPESQASIPRASTSTLTSAELLFGSGVNGHAGNATEGPPENPSPPEKPFLQPPIIYYPGELAGFTFKQFFEGEFIPYATHKAGRGYPPSSQQIQAILEHYRGVGELVAVSMLRKCIANNWPAISPNDEHGKPTMPGSNGKNGAPPKQSVREKLRAKVKADRAKREASTPKEPKP